MGWSTAGPPAGFCDLDPGGWRVGGFGFGAANVRRAASFERAGSLNMLGLNTPHVRESAEPACEIGEGTRPNVRARSLIGAASCAALRCQSTVWRSVGSTLKRGD